MTSTCSGDRETRGLDQHGQVKDIGKPCPRCKSRHFIKTATQTICVPCGRRDIDELAADYAEGEVMEGLEVA